MSMERNDHTVTNPPIAASAATSTSSAIRTSDFHPDLLAARLPIDFRSTPAWCSPRPCQGTRRCTQSEPEHDPRGLPTAGDPVTSRVATEPGRMSRTSTGASRRGGPRRDIAEMLRRAAQAAHPGRGRRGSIRGGHRAKAPGALVHVLFAECTNADAGYDGRPPTTLPRSDRGRGHAARRPADRSSASTTTSSQHDFTPTRPRPSSTAACPSSPCSSARASRARPRDRRPEGRLPGRAGLRIGAARRTCRDARAVGTTGVELLSASMESEEDLALIDRTADVILLLREAIANASPSGSAGGADPALVLRLSTLGARAPSQGRRTDRHARRTEAIPAGA